MSQRRRFPDMIFIMIMTIFSHVYAQNQSDPVFSIAANYPIWSPQQKARVYLQQKPSLLVLLSPECPMCANYMPLLKKINKEHGDVIQVAGIIPGRTYDDDAVLNFSGAYDLNFPLYTDSIMQLTRYLKGEVTPAVYLFDGQGKLVYHGAIDNWMSALGRKRTRVDQHYLLDGIQQMLKGSIVALTYVKPQGCLLNEY